MMDFVKFFKSSPVSFVFGFCFAFLTIGSVVIFIPTVFEQYRGEAIGEFFCKNEMYEERELFNKERKELTDKNKSLNDLLYNKSEELSRCDANLLNINKDNDEKMKMRSKILLLEGEVEKKDNFISKLNKK